MSNSYNSDKPRPLGIRIFDHREEGGISEKKALEHNGVTADAFLLMRVLVEEDKVALAYTALEGWTAGEMSFDALFNLWLALASRIAHQNTEGQPDHERKRQFAQRMLQLLRLSVQLGRLEVDQKISDLEAMTPPTTEPSSR